MRDSEPDGVRYNAEWVSRWYAVHTQPHREGRAAAHLRHQGFPVFLPWHAKTVRHARQFRTVRAPFFPRYLFVRLTIGRDRWRSVNGTFGVSGMIMEGGRPLPVVRGVVEALMGMTDESGMLSLDRCLRLGQTVRIARGPFAGLVGELAAMDEKGRVKVLLDIIGKQVTVATSGTALVPAA